MTSPQLTIDGSVATITLSRPEQANRLEPDDLVAIVEHIQNVNQNSDVLVLRIASTGKYFCSGYDIGSFGTSRTVEFDVMVNALEDARPVTIAVLQGGVYGGATDLALACDFRVGVTAMDMFMPAARLGLHFYRRGMQRYVTRLGLDNAKRLFLTSDRIDAAEMKAIGFLTQLVEVADLAATVERLTGSLTDKAPLALLGMKKHLNRMARGVLDEDDLLDDIAKAAASADLKEGRLAWAEKRPPRFVGR